VTDVAPPLPAELGELTDVVVLWRPGCPFCGMLLRRLDRSGLQFTRVDIWEHPEAAAWVRTVADGNETVPTVRVRSAEGQSAVALVNPQASAVLEHVRALTPRSLVPGPSDGSGTPMTRLGSALRRLLRGRQGRGHGPVAPR